MIIVWTPTYNEKGNIEELIRKVFSLPLENLHMAVIDDDSPDGTAAAAAALKNEFPRLDVIVRKEKKGRGLSGREAYLNCLDRKADIIVEMDADLSHDPEDIPRLINELNSSADIAVGSRYVKGGKFNIGIMRKINSFVANLICRVILNYGLKDSTSGFRAFQREALLKIKPQTLISTGPEIVEEVYWRAKLLNLKIKEIPIEFNDREKGESKLNFKKIITWLLNILKIKRRGTF